VTARRVAFTIVCEQLGMSSCRRSGSSPIWACLLTRSTPWRPFIRRTSIGTVELHRERLAELLADQLETLARVEQTLNRTNPTA
jgi:hypothetical protein